MARAWWTATICVGLGASLLPGCALLGPRPAQSGGAAITPAGRGARTEEKTVSPPPNQDPLVIDIPPDPAYHPASEREPSPGAGLPPEAARQPAPSQHPADEAQGADEHPPEHHEPGPPVQKATVAYEMSPPPKKEPLLEALECFLQDRPERALEQLKGYQQSSQEIYIRLLPVLAELTHKGVDQLTPEEASAVHEQLSGLAAELRPRARLVIDRVCLCDHIQGYGLYRPLPEGHAFRARGPDQQGELVQLYVEVRNFAVEPCPQGFVTRLSSSVEICDASGKQWWFHSFQEGPLYRQAPWQDCFGNYCFYLPHLPPGSYTLTIHVRDLTRPEALGKAHKSLALRVG